MRLIVETGAGILNANSYIDTADVERYMPYSIYRDFKKLPADDQIDKMAVASLFIDYSFNWRGRQKTLEQGLSWPRIGVFFQGHHVSDNSIPIQVRRATVMALRLIIEYGVGVFQKTGEAQVKRERLGPLETEYFEALKETYLYASEYSDINNILKGFFIVPGGVVTAEVLRR